MGLFNRRDSIGNLRKAQPIKELILYLQIIYVVTKIYNYWTTQFKKNSEIFVWHEFQVNDQFPPVVVDASLPTTSSEIRVVFSMLA